jgi:hypothetical protein
VTAVVDYQAQAYAMATDSGREQAIDSIARYLHHEETMHMHSPPYGKAPCGYCWLRAGRAVRILGLLNLLAPPSRWAKPGVSWAEIGLPELGGELPIGVDEGAAPQGPHELDGDPEERVAYRVRLRFTCAGLTPECTTELFKYGEFARLSPRVREWRTTVADKRKKLYSPQVAISRANSVLGSVCQEYGVTSLRVSETHVQPTEPPADDEDDSG